MEPDEMIQALRICGNHPTMEGFGCLDCPYCENCDPRDSTRLDLMAADTIEKLLAEVKRLKPYEQAVDQILKPDNDKMMGRSQ